MREFLSQWSSVLWGAIGGAGGMWALVKFLPETVVGHFLDARLEKVRGEIRRDVDAEIEGIRHELGREATQRDLQFTRVYDRQLRTLERLYAALSELQVQALAFTTKWEFTTAPTLEERAVQVGEAYDVFVKVYYPRRIWLDDDTQKQIEEYLAVVRSAVNERRLAARQRPEAETVDHWDKAWDAANGEGEKMRKGIEKRFREVLGVLDIHLVAE